MTAPPPAATAASDKPQVTSSGSAIPLKRIGGQGLLLMSGFAGAQACAFVRNALLGHWLSQGDFGIAAAITLMLQLVDTLSDLGAERLLIQARDGENPQLQATAHALLIARGIVTSLLLVLAAGPITAFFGIGHAQWAFETIALAPLVKGFMHLDARRYQRSLINRPYVLTEILPQALTLAVALPLLSASPSYGIVVWLALAQAGTALVISHAVAERRYQVALQPGYLRRLIAFGWPIWLSALPLAAVYQGDRMIVGRYIGMEELAAYTAAFLVTMVPGLLAARVGNALMLPLLAEARGNRSEFQNRYRSMLSLTSIFAAAYLTGFLAAGDSLLRIAFGQNYDGLGMLCGWLALMWALRMIQAVPGMSLMAEGDTRPLLWAGLIRALGLPMAIFAIHQGHGLIGAAAAGTAAEALSLVYVVWRNSRHATPGGIDASRSAMILLIGGGMGAGIATLGMAPDNPLMDVALAGIAALSVAAIGLAGQLQGWRTPARIAATP